MSNSKTHHVTLLSFLIEVNCSFTSRGGDKWLHYILVVALNVGFSCVMETQLCTGGGGPSHCPVNLPPCWVLAAGALQEAA